MDIISKFNHIKEVIQYTLTELTPDLITVIWSYFENSLVVELAAVMRNIAPSMQLPTANDPALRKASLLR